MKRLLLFLSILVTWGLSNVWAYDFSAVAPSGHTLYYNIVNDNAEVTFQYYLLDENYYNLTGTLVIPSSVTYNGNTYSVTSIGNYAFFTCARLTSVTIPNSVTSIGDYAFKSCWRLTSMTIPDSVTSIGNYAFHYCNGLTSVTIPNSVTSIGNYAFHYCSGLTSVTIPNSVTSIGDATFYGCSGLTSVTIPNSVTSIGDATFYGCSGLTSVTIPNSVTSIGDATFYGCSGLTSVTIPNSVTSIGWSAFADCSGLKNMSIGNSITSIGNYAFRDCIKLTSIISYSVTPPDVESNTFDGVNKAIPLNVPSEAVQSYTNAYGWRDFTNIIGISTQGIDEVEGSVIRCMGNRVFISSASGQMLSIYDITGRMIIREQVVEDKQYSMPHSGVYMVQVGNDPARKVVVVK